MAANASDEQEFEAKVLQLAMAFGQGAGTMMATGEALQTALAPYSAALRQTSAEQWNDERYGLKLIEYARAAGAMAAAAAVRDQKFVIGTVHVNFVVEALRRTTSDRVALLGPCNC